MVISESTLGIGLATGSAVALTFFNVPITVLGAGMLACTLGVAGRAAYDIQRALKRDERVRGARIAGWVCAGLLGSPMATLGVMLAYESYFKQDPDGVIALLLLAIGFGGQDVIGPIWYAVARFLNKRFDLDIDVPTKEPPK